MGTEAERNEKEAGWCPLGQRQPRELGTHHSRAKPAWRASTSPAACIWSPLREDISKEGVLTTPPQPPKTRGGLLRPQLPTPSAFPPHGQVSWLLPVYKSGFMGDLGYQQPEDRSPHSCPGQPPVLRVWRMPAHNSLRLLRRTCCKMQAAVMAFTNDQSPRVRGELFRGWCGGVPTERMLGSPPAVPRTGGLSQY